MVFRLGLPNTKRGEFNGDGAVNLRRYRQLRKRIANIKDPARKAQVVKRARAQLARARGSGGPESDVLPRGRVNARGHRVSDQRTFDRQAALETIRAPRAASFSPGRSPF